MAPRSQKGSPIMNGSPVHRSRGEAGYSLAEMLTVIAIIGALSLVLVPQFMNFMSSNKVKTGMRVFTTDVRKMRALAISRGVQTKLSYTTGGSARTYTLWMGNSAWGTMATQVWTPLSGLYGTGTKTLDNVLNFPADAGPTPQWFVDEDPATSPNGDLDIIFFPDGRVKMPVDPNTGTTRQYGAVTIKTPLSKVYKTTYEIDISPVGRVEAK
jgi:prepilin-type N-terminal cleavage/methylation domain-containing protein